MATMATAVTRLSDEMRSFKDEMRDDRRDLNRQLGDIANAQGRLVEDLVAPSIPRVLRRLLDLPADAAIAPCGPRLRLRHPTDASRTRELDVVAGHDGVALVVEVKSQLAPEGVTRFASSLEDAHSFLAPLGIREVMGAVATLHADASIVAHASRLGILVLAVGDEMMEPKNPPGFVPRRVS